MFLKKKIVDNKFPSDVLNVITVDVEEYFQVEAFSGFINKEDWEKYPNRVEEQTDRLLDLLDSYGIKGTFFILGWLAERNPSLIKKIHDAGHEIASHGFEHTMITNLTREEFRKDIRRSKNILEKIIGTEIKGYRAPTFSIVKETGWAYEILLEEGFQYSSSVYPIQHDRYGWPEFGITPRIMAKNGVLDIWEVPMSAGQLGPMHIPFAGGGYLRAYPLFITKWFLNQFRRNGKSIIMYIHPWELDGHYPAVKAPFLRRMRHFYGIPSVFKKLDRLLKILKFDTMENLVNRLKMGRESSFGK
jgi:polysaccharide deacetylase family protein (PEP-CTERM system associated)